jgi:hypothetical protein
MVMTLGYVVHKNTHSMTDGLTPIESRCMSYTSKLAYTHERSL